MKTVLYSLLISILPMYSSLQKNTFIDWRADYKLVWDDFKEKPDPNSPNAALTSTETRFDFHYSDNNLTYHIVCHFDKTRSWGRVKNDYILAHEQGHFDIAEIHARLLNKRLKAYTVKNINKLSKDANDLYEKTMKEMNEMQAAYDSETSNSIKKEQQGEWLKKISALLKEFEPYADYH